MTSGVDGSICQLSIEGIAEGIQRLYQHPEELKLLARNCASSNYENQKELEKLYELV